MNCYCVNLDEYHFFMVYAERYVFDGFYHMFWIGSEIVCNVNKYTCISVDVED